MRFMKFLRTNSEGINREGEAVSTETEIITSGFSWWKELMLRVISDKQTDRQTHIHTTTANTRASLAPSRG